jgi:hypothetical protein
MAYDQAKAAAYNRARAQGLNQADALNAAGIGPTERFSYATGSNGQIGPREQIVANLGQQQGTVSQTASGSTDSQGRPVEVLTGEAAARARAEEAAFQATGAVPITPYAQTASPAPGTIRTTNYTEESTTSISGGGSTTIVATPGRPTAASQALDAQAQQTQREIEALQLANSGFGPGPQLSEQQQEANDARILQLQQQYNSQRDAAESAKTPTPPSINVVPNTTTTVNTVAFERSVEVTPVNADDPAQIVRSTEAGVITRVETASANEVNPDQDPFEARRLELEQELNDPPPTLTAEDVEDPFEARRLELEQELNNPPPTLTTEDVGEEDPFEARRRELEQELNREELAASNFNPEPVNPGSDPGIGGTAYDDDGFLNPGWTLNENNEPVFVGGGFVEPATAESAAASREAATKLRAKQQATFQARYKQTGNQDWRVRLSLSPNANYLYNAGTPRGSGAGILAPLANTDGVIFPYTPTISTTYSANYEQYDLVHSNYRGVFYKNSRVGDINIRGTFTAQDTNEANYLLAVIHFFRSATKMFYGQDAERGTPPPVCLLNGLGTYQFSDHPVVISSFSYTTPNEVDYIRAASPNNYGSNLLNRRAAVASNPGGSSLAGLNRLLNALPTGLAKGAENARPAPSPINQNVNNTAGATYVPTKIEIDITLIPVQTRAQVSKQFSLKGFANGELLKGGFW